MASSVVFFRSGEVSLFAAAVGEELQLRKGF
jgi:hypothetical protein